MIKTWNKRSEVQRLSFSLCPAARSRSIYYATYPIPSRSTKPCPIQLPLYATFIPQNIHIHASIYLFAFFPFPLINLSALIIFRGPEPESASRRPIFPKQTQLQNNTLNIQTAPSRLSPLIKPCQSPPFTKCEYF